MSDPVLAQVEAAPRVDDEALMTPETKAGPMIVVVGASNLHLGLLPLALAIDRASGRERPLVLAAPGAGRSYGKPAGFLGLLYPGHAESGIVAEALSRGAADRRRVALLMDIGNDIGYGEEPEQIVAWVKKLADELSAEGFPVLVQRPPVASVAALPRARFAVVRRLYFRRVQLSRAELLSRAARVDRGLCALACDGVEIVESPLPLIGPDGIHVAPWHLPVFWTSVARELCARVGLPAEGAATGGRIVTLLHGLRARALKPRRYARFGAWREARRFETRLPGGTTVVRL